jgi:MoaA/NifB/PqqE/SkfB family radical SAM enzyme
VVSPAQLRANLLVKLGEITHRTHVLPFVLFAPTARCNSRCVSCDWWKNDGADDLSLDEIRRIADELPRHGTRTVVFTGGEPLLRQDTMAIADLFRERGLTLHLLTSGLALERMADAIAARFQDVTISLDGHTPELYRAIRGVNALEAIGRGVARLRALAPRTPIRARSTIHRHNFRFLPDLVDKAMELGLGQISFLAADVSSDAFNRPGAKLPLAADDGGGPGRTLLLTEEETAELGGIIEGVIRSHRRAFDERRVVPGPDGLRRLALYYRAHLGLGPFPSVDCNAPWTSVVIEANGSVRPCFFHAPVGNLRQRPLAELLVAAMPRFRRSLDVASNQTCQRCVCTLKVGLRSAL